LVDESIRVSGSRSEGVEMEVGKGEHEGFGRRRGWRVVMVSLVLLAVVIAVFWLPGRIRRATAAEIMDHANQVWGALGQNVGVVYQKFYVMIDNAPMPYAATTEVWRSADGTQVRYQMTDAQGRLIYFMLRNGDKLWRSGPLATLALTPVASVFPESLAQYQQELAVGQGPSILLEVAAGVDRLPPAGQACADLKCFLGDWTLENGVSLTRGVDMTENGHPAAMVKMAYAGDLEGPASCILVVDSESFLMLEYIDPSGNMLHVLDYRGLPADEVPPDLFTSFPSGVNTMG